MDEQPIAPRHGRWWRVSAAVGLGLLTLSGMAVLVAHTPPVRGAVLRYVSRTLLASGLRLEAERLDYNLVTQRVGLTRVRLSADNETPPFFEADEVWVRLSPRLFLGTIDIEMVTVDRGVVRVVRRRDGSSNLPRSAASTEEPSPLRFGRVVASDLAVQFSDEALAVDIQAPAVALDISARGRITIAAPIDASLGTNGTQITALDGALAFDGRDLQFDDLHIEATEGSLDLTGTLALVRREPTVDAHVTGRVNLASAVRWGGVQADAVRGVAQVDADVRGPIAGPSADFRLAADRLAWNAVELADVSAVGQVDGDGVTVEPLQFGVARGTVRGSGSLRFGTGDLDVQASWQDLDVATVVDLVSSPALTPSGRTTGQISVRGLFNEPERWMVEARVAVGAGENRRGRVSIPGDARLVVNDGRWHLDARHLVGGAVPVAASLDGSLQRDDLGASSLGGEVRVASTQVAALTRVLSVTGLADLPPDLATGPVSAQLVIGGILRQPTIDVQLEGPILTVAQQPLTDVRVRGSLTLAEVSVEEFSAGQVGPGEALESAGRIEAAGRYQLDAGTYQATAKATGWRLFPTTDLPIGGAVDAEFAGTGQGRSVTGEGHVGLASASWAGRDLGAVTADIALEGDHAQIDARLPAFDTVGIGTVWLAAPFQTNARVTVNQLELSRLLTAAGVSRHVDGRTSLQLDVDGPLDEWRQGRALLEVGTLEAQEGDLAARLTEPARVRYAGGRLLVDRLEAAAGDVVLSASGGLPVARSDSPDADDAVVVTMRGSANGVVRALEMGGLVPASGVTGDEGPVSLNARVTGAVDAPLVSADLEVGPASVQFRPGLPAITGVRVRAHLERDQLQLSELTASYEGARLMARGEVPVALLLGTASGDVGGSGALQARLLDVSPSTLAPLVDVTLLGQITGSIDATVDLTAPTLALDDLRGDIVLERFDMAMATLPVQQRVPTRVAVRDGLAQVMAWNWVGEGATLELVGQVGLRDLRADLALDGQLDMRVLAPLIRETGVTAAGRLEPHIAVAGVLNDPVVTGDLQLHGGEFRLADPGIVVSAVEARAVLTRGQASLTALTGTINGGTLTGGGEVQYAPTIAGRLTVDVAGMALDFPRGLRSALGADLELVLSQPPGEAVASGRLDGTVTIAQSAYREPLGLVTTLLAGLQGRAATPAGRAEPSFLDQVELNVRVVTDEDLVVRNNVARAQISADLRVIGTASNPSLSGRAELGEGGQLFLGRNTYTVQSGTIDFANPARIEPRLGIVANTRAGGEDIEIRISGTPDTLTTALSSPSAPELGQADLTSLLLTGRPIDELGSAQAAAVSAQVLGNFTGDVLGVAGRAIGLDTLRVGGAEGSTTRLDPADLAAEVDPTSRLTFGKSFGSMLDITLSQSLRAGDAQTWIIDYKPARQVALRWVSDDSDLQSLAFRHDLVFGATPRSNQVRDRNRAIALPRVSAVRLLGSPGVPEEELRQRLRLRVGDRFDFIEWQADRDRLERYYRDRQRLAAHIAVTRESVTGGVELTYDIDAGPRTLVMVSGVELPGRVVAEIETTWAEAVFDGFVTEGAARVIRAHLARGGYLRPVVTARIEERGDDRTLIVEVQPGDQTRTTDVTIDGVEEPLHAELVGVAARLAEDGRAVAAPTAFGREFVDYLRARGFVDADVSVGTPVFEGPVVTVPLTVSTGSPYVIGTVAIDGARLLSAETLLDDVAIAPGSAYSPASVDTARARLQGHYRLEGFTSTSVQVRQDVRVTESAMNVTFTVVEGPRQVVGEVSITGTQSIDEAVVRRALKLPAGEPLRAADWLQARQRLFDTGLFRRVDITLETMEGVDPDARPDIVPMRVRVLLEEWPTLRLRYGFQVAEERPEDNVDGRNLAPGVSADVTRRTLFGRAVSVGAAGQYSQRLRLGRLFASTPTFLSLPVQSSLVFERARKDVAADTLVTDTTALIWQQQVRRAALNLSYGLRFERNHTFDTAAPLDPDFPVFDVTARVGSLTGGAAWDTRDDAADTRRGTLVSSTIEHANRTLGSDLLFVRSLTQAYYFYPWRGVVLASAARFGAVQARGGQDVTPSELFYAGGARTVRGLPEGSLGGRDVLGYVVGGKGMLILNQEARFPLYRWFGGVAFIDTGAVFPELTDIGLGSLTGSGGLGLRIATPFAVLRADYGKTLWRAPVDGGSWTFTFGLGHTF